MIAVIHPTGNANLRGVLAGLYGRSMLSGFYTTLGVSRAAAWLRWLPGPLRLQILRRSYDLPTGLINTRPILGVRRLVSGRFSNIGFTRRHRNSIDQVYFDLDRHLARLIARGRTPEGARAVYGYEDGCRDSFRAARKVGWSTFYELPIGYWRAGRRIAEEEAELQPQWATTWQALDEPPDKLARKDEELALADRVFAASSFTRETLKEAPSNLKTVEIIPYGAPACRSVVPVSRKPGEPLRALFVGGLSQRKGLSYLFSAVESLGGSVRLTLIGRKPAGCKILDEHLARHNWIASLPHEQLIDEMGRHDVLVFPSLFEGFGLVILEAMSQGLPVITTAHTAGPDILTEGSDGFVVPIRSAEGIAGKLSLLYEDPDLLEAMKVQAVATARQWTWEKYQDRVATALSAALSD
ncbi:MAG: glycosyltransferase family 4 protein [Proteobacteria bacterium]|nr:glycosyltransferase family 4 protein [Pseudomonadota bacterium]